MGCRQGLMAGQIRDSANHVPPSVGRKSEEGVHLPS